MDVHQLLKPKGQARWSIKLEQTIASTHIIAASITPTIESVITTIPELNPTALSSYSIKLIETSKTIYQSYSPSLPRQYN